MCKCGRFSYYRILSLLCDMHFPAIKGAKKSKFSFLPQIWWGQKEAFFQVPVF